MPRWHFFSFNAQAVAEAILSPAQNAVRNTDAGAWRAIYDTLERSGVGGMVPRWQTLSADQVPDESLFPLRRALQLFVEQEAVEHLESEQSGPRHWILHEIDWSRYLVSQAEHDQLALFTTEVIARRTRLPDPFWCLESNDAVDSNYVSADIVRRIAEAEETVGLFRRVVSLTTDVEHQMFARDIAAAGSLVGRAAGRELALYYREDGT
jgi:hypothetical protein